MLYNIGRCWWIVFLFCVMLLTQKNLESCLEMLCRIPRMGCVCILWQLCPSVGNVTVCQLSGVSVLRTMANSQKSEVRPSALEEE